MVSNEKQNKQLEIAAAKRIQDSQEWAARGFSDFDEEIRGLKIRNYQCRVKPLAFLDDPDRVERYGIRFRLSWAEEDGSYFADLDIRIQPRHSLKKDQSGEIFQGPTIVYYVGGSSLLRWKELVPTNLHAELSVQEFFVIQLKYVCQNSKCQDKIYSERSRF